MVFAGYYSFFYNVQLVDQEIPINGKKSDDHRNLNSKSKHISRPLQDAI